MRIRHWTSTVRRNVASLICSGSSPALLRYLTDDADADNAVGDGRVSRFGWPVAVCSVCVVCVVCVTVTLTACSRASTFCIALMTASHAPGASADFGSANHD